MKNRRWSVVWLTGLCVTAGRVWATPASYQVIQKMAMPSDDGWDYLTVDPDMRRLYISRHTHVDVVDIDVMKISTQIAGTPGVHGIALSPDRGFISNGEEGTVTIFDRKTEQFIGKTKVGEGPDAILFDPASQRVFTFCGKSHEAWALDAASGQAVGRIPLSGKPEFAVADGNGTVYDDIESHSEMVTIDSRNLKIKQKWPLAPCEDPSSLAIDAVQHRLFVGCGNQRMAVVDADSGQVITTLPIGDHVDATVFDPGTNMIFNANGDGTLTVIHEDSPSAYHIVQTVTTQKGARTVALDPKTHQLYLVSAQYGAIPQASTDNPHARPSILAGSVGVLVVDKK